MQVIARHESKQFRKCMPELDLDALIKSSPYIFTRFDYFRNKSKRALQLTCIVLKQELEPLSKN